MSHFPATPIRVGILHMEPLRAAGLEALFENHAGIKIIVPESAANLEEFWLDPSLGILVVGSLLGKGTLRRIAAIRSDRADLPILVMSPAAGDEAVLSVLDLGAKGILHEMISPETFEEAIRAVAGGSIWAPRRLLAELIRRMQTARNSPRDVAAIDLTPREREVLDLLVDGRSNREIARSLAIEERTVKSYVTRLLRKMDVKNRTALSMLALSGQRADAT